MKIGTQKMMKRPMKWLFRPVTYNNYDLSLFILPDLYEFGLNNKLVS